MRLHGRKVQPDARAVLMRYRFGSYVASRRVEHQGVYGVARNRSRGEQAVCDECDDRLTAGIFDRPNVDAVAGFGMGQEAREKTYQHSAERNERSLSMEVGRTGASLNGSTSFPGIR